MLTIFSFFLGLFTTAEAASPKMIFRYEPFEGEGPSQCVHEQIQDLPDWRVTCDTPYGKKKFTAHVVLRELPRKELTGLEILYWVTEPGEKPNAPPKFHSTSALFTLKGNTSLDHFSLSQGVENDFASLTLAWVRGSD